MRLTVCLDPATEVQHYADDCDLSTAPGTPVKMGDKQIGTLVRAWAEDGSLWGEIEIEEDAPIPPAVKRREAHERQMSEEADYQMADAITRAIRQISGGLEGFGS